jgi:hypothetical protein
MRERDFRLIELISSGLGMGLATPYWMTMPSGSRGRRMAAHYSQMNIVIEEEIYVEEVRRDC